nr:pickpocket protein 28-like isoform X1 [Leptinotarsa decemlineata]
MVIMVLDIQTVSAVNNEKVPKKKKNFKRIHQYFKEYCDNTSIHGFHYLAEKRTVCEKILWLVLITTALASCGYLISQIYSKFNQSPVIVSFATKESPIYSIPFPAVTFCPMSKARKQLFNFTDVIYKMRDKKNLTFEDKLNGQYMSVVCEFGTELFPQNETFTDDFFQKLDEIRIPLKYLLYECKLMNVEVDCFNIFTPIILDESVCYTYNMLDRSEIFNPNVFQFSDYHENFQKSNWSIDEGYAKNSGMESYPTRAFLAGADNSLQITFIQNTTDLDYLCLDDIQGFSVLLHAPYTIPLVKKQYFQVPFDRAAIAVVQPKLMTTSEAVKKYSPEKRECYFTTEKKLKYFKQYSPTNCKLECLSNYTEQECGCVNFYMPREKTTPICGNGRLRCIHDAEMALKIIQLETQISSDREDFFCDCKPLCTELRYNIEESQSEWDYKEQYRARGIGGFDEMGKSHPIKTGKGRSFITESSVRLAKLSVFFKQESFLTSQRNELYGPTDFLANFGGLLGLFTGFSLLSAAEILYFLTIRLCCNFRLYRSWTGANTEI